MCMQQPASNPAWSLPMVASTVMGANAAMAPPWRSFDVSSIKVWPGNIPSPSQTVERSQRIDLVPHLPQVVELSGNGGGGNGTVGIAGVVPSAMPTSAAIL